MKGLASAALAAAATVIVIAGAVLLYVKTTGLTARPHPGSLETRAARALRSLAVPAAVRDQANPVPRSQEETAQGMAHYADHCAVCHANDGSGNVQMGRGLWPKPPDMREDATQQLSDGELFYIIEEGIRFTGMPGWSTGTEEGTRASWQLVNFIRHLPRITAAELEAMADMNPRPPSEIRQEIEEQRFLEGDALPAAP
jgi:mono/diheme cytochrome c family protein